MSLYLNNVSWFREKQSFFLLLQCSILSGEAAHTNLKVACLNQTVLVYRWIVFSVSYRNKNPTQRVVLVQNKHHHHLIKNVLFSPSYGWKIGLWSNQTVLDPMIYHTRGEPANYHTIDLFIMHITEIHRTVEWCPFAFWVNKSCRINSPVTYGGSYCLIFSFLCSIASTIVMVW
jgi:hypothetical protein